MVTNVVLALAALLLGVLATYHYSSRRRVSYIAVGRSVLDPVGGEHPPEVEISFDGLKVHSLDEWRIVLWNSGNQTINESEVAEWLKCRFGNDNVLKVTEPITNRPATRPRLNISDNAVTICFDYLDRHDYVAFSAYVVPPVEDDGVFEVTASIRGIPRGPVDQSSLPVLSTKESCTYAITLLMTIVFSSFFAYRFLQQGQALGLWQFFDSIASEIRSSGSRAWIALFLAPLLSTLSLVAALHTARILYRSLVRVPAGVRAHYVKKVRFGSRVAAL